LNKLTEQLRKAGLLSEDKYREQTTREKSRERRRSYNAMQANLKLAKTSRVTCVELSGRLSINEFKQTAKRILLESPGAIQGVLKKANELPHGPERKHLVWFCYQVRDGLQNASSSDDKERFLKRAFRKAGATLGDASQNSI